MAKRLCFHHGSGRDFDHYEGVNDQCVYGRYGGHDFCGHDH